MSVFYHRPLIPDYNMISFKFSLTSDFIENDAHFDVHFDAKTFMERFMF